MSFHKRIAKAKAVYFQGTGRQPRYCLIPIHEWVEFLVFIKEEFPEMVGNEAIIDSFEVMGVCC